MEDTPLVVSKRVLDMLRAPVRGSQAVPCSRCGEAVWLSPASVPLLEQGGSVLCLPCFQETYQDGEIGITPETLREVQEALGRPVTMADLAFLVARWKAERGKWWPG